MLAFPEYHSPSSLKTWRNAPKLWCARYLYDWKSPGGPKMWRGIAVEAGFVSILHKQSFQEALLIAHARYFSEAKGEANEEHEGQVRLIEPMLRQLITWHEKNPLELARTQTPVLIYLDGVKSPLKGYIDLSWMDGPDTDIKTTEACPQTGPRNDDLRQVSIYGKARGRPQSILYVTPKKTAFFAPSEADMEAALAEMAEAARSLELFLTLMPDRESAIRCLAGNDHFSFDDAAKAKLAELGV